MHPPPTPSRNAFPIRCYRAALRLYPAAHRDRFGLEMEQVFYQQWRKVREKHSMVAALAFSLRITSDVLLTSCYERLHSLLSWLPLKHPLSPFSRLLWSLGAGVPVALLILTATVAVTFALPTRFESTTRIAVWHRIPDSQPTAVQDPFHIQAESAAILSDNNLLRVAETLSLSQRYSDEHHLRGPLLQPGEIIPILRSRISVEPYRNTGIVGIRVQGYDRNLAADIANTLANTYIATRRGAPVSVPGQDASLPEHLRVNVIDVAVPGLRPLGPNIYLNTFLGGMIGTGLGLMTAVVVWLLLPRVPKARHDDGPPGRAMPA